MRRMPFYVKKRLRQRSCGERRIGLHQTMSCGTCIPAYSCFEEKNVEMIPPPKAWPMSVTDDAGYYVAAVRR